MKTCLKCTFCCPKNGFPCITWEMLSCEGESDEAIAKDCNRFKPVVKEPEEDDRYYSPHEAYFMRELF